MSAPSAGTPAERGMERAREFYGCRLFDDGSPMHSPECFLHAGRTKEHGCGRLTALLRRVREEEREDCAKVCDAAWSLWAYRDPDDEQPRHPSEEGATQGATLALQEAAQTIRKGA